MPPDRRPRIHDDNPDPASRGDRKAMRRAPLSGDILPARSRPGSFGESDELDENPSPEDVERFGDVTKTCPECRKDVFDDSAVCYHCGHAFEREAAGSSRTPWWIVAVVVILLIAFGIVYVF